MPRTFGDSIIHSSQIDVMVEDDLVPYTRNPGVLTDVEDRIGDLVANNLVDNGATLQMGISRGGRGIYEHFFQKPSIIRYWRGARRYAKTPEAAQELGDSHGDVLRRHFAADGMRSH